MPENISQFDELQNGDNMQQQGQFENGAFMPPENRRAFDQAINDLNKGFVYASSLIGGYREGSPELERAWLRLQELRSETIKVGVDLMPFG